MSISAMKNLYRYAFRLVGVILMVLAFPACNQQSSETAKEFYLEQMEKTNAWQRQHAQHEEQKEEKRSDKQSEPAPAKLVPDGK
jgi:hypothetical protein